MENKEHGEGQESIESLQAQYTVLAGEVFELATHVGKYGDGNMGGNLEEAVARFDALHSVIRDRLVDAGIRTGKQGNLDLSEPS